MTAQPEADNGQELRLSVGDIADHFGVSPRTVYNWRQTGYGPPSFRVGKYLRYRMADVLDWERQQLAAEGH